MAENNFTNRKKTVGMDMVAPYGVYHNSDVVAVYDNASDASRHYRQLRRSLMTPLQVRLERQRTRTALQAPISENKRCVLFLKEKKECRTPWFYRLEHAQRALQIIKQKYGDNNAIIYVD